MKRKKIYEPRKVLVCSRCNTRTAHSLCDYENGIYKCLICNAVYTKKK